MTALQSFTNCIGSARQLTAMYSELRESRKLGARGRLDTANEDLLWLPRSAVVIAMAGLDAYVQAVLDDQIPRVLKSGSIPDSLCKKLSDVMPVKNSESFRDALPIIKSSNFEETIYKKLREDNLQFLSFQTPAKIDDAYVLIGKDDIFTQVASTWPGPATGEDELRKRIVKYNKRRNEIAHEGDVQSSGVARRMQPQYAIACADFIENLVIRLNRIVYGL